MAVNVLRFVSISCCKKLLHEVKGTPNGRVREIGENDSPGSNKQSQLTTKRDHVTKKNIYKAYHTNERWFVRAIRYSIPLCQSSIDIEFSFR